MQNSTGTSNNIADTERELARREATLGAEHHDVAFTLNHLAGLYLQRGEHARARSLYERALAICQTVHGEEHEHVATQLCNLAVAHDMMGAYREAQPLHERALQIRERLFGAEHPELAHSLYSLAQRYRALGHHNDARSHFERALRIWENALGIDHPNVASALNGLGLHHLDQGEYAQAIPRFERALRIHEHVHGPEHPSVAASLSNLAGAHKDQGAYDRALPLFERALQIHQRVLGSEHPDIAKSLGNLAALHRAQGRFADAQPLYERALRIHERTLGTNHPDVALSLNNLALLLEQRGVYDEAEALHIRALNIKERVFGAEHSSVATSLDNLALLYQEQGAYAKAVPLHDRALAIREQVFGPNHGSVATSLDNLANAYRAQGAYAAAAQRYERALSIWETTVGPDHPDLAISIASLAGLYERQGDWARSEPMQLRALQMRERLLGDGHPDVAESLHNLAGLYQNQGAYARAEPLLRRALQICECAFGPEHPQVATELNDLGALHAAQGADAEAEAFHQRALQIRERALGPDHPHVATSLNHLASLHAARGDHPRAESLHQRALNIQESALGPSHPDVAVSLNNLAGLYSDQGAWAQAAPMNARALRIWETALGADHLSVATLLTNSALLAWCTGDLSRAVQYLERADDVEERNLQRTLAVLPEPRKRQFLQTRSSLRKVVASLHAHHAPEDRRALDLALRVTLRRKGRLLEEVGGELAALRRQMSPALQDELDSLQARRDELAVGRRSAAETGNVRTLQALERLAEEVEQREGELSRKSAAFRASLESATIAHVQAAIPADAALVEFVHCRRYDPRAGWKEAHYVAYVLLREGPPRWVALGEAELVEATAMAALSAVATPGRDARPLLRALDELVFAPIRRLVGLDHYLLSPDAALHLVPFAAMVDEDARYLVERFRLTYVTSGRDLLPRATSETYRSAPVAIAAPDYGGRHAPLDGAKAEAQALQNHFPETRLHTGAEATRDKLMAARGPRFVHLATHGFSGPSRTAAGSRRARAIRDIIAVSLPQLPSDQAQIEDALDEAGLIFAGATEAEATLTARQIAGVDLGGTQLVVLAACDSGLGTVAESEGIYGLRRAIAIAGAETQLASLWRAYDVATCELMDRYYAGLRSGEGRSEALRQAQLRLLGGGPYAHPCYWATFIPIGNESPL